ncbi:hypothetical protein [Sedimentibacter sp. MB31-C6]|uniref:hypothetical protein n=1 Tax=Sedimentibacter sp. MB31-C6 TaxID=3109366 RepID=UPI002DDD89C4|nr:hypothetical protein [Sedimentibacter sp. MB36-C1]WSI04277.1 hypothetical protein U8307_00435 [Sedimentibacter sp. MB36-C1]
MDNVLGYPLREALKFIEEKNSKIIKIIKITGTNKKFNDLHKPYVIRENSNNNYVTLFVSYY